MSDFSATLKEIVAKNKFTITAIAKTTDIDRSKLSNTMSGKAMLSPEQAERLIAVLPLVPADREKLRVAYEISKYGKDAYEKRQKVKKIIENMSQSTYTPTAFATTDKPHTFTPAPVSQAPKTFHGEYAVHTAMSQILDSETDIVRFSVSPSRKSFYKQLYAKYSSCSTLEIECFISLLQPSGDSDGLANLDALESLIPFIISPRHQFQAYYSYACMTADEMHTVLFPYFIQTSQQVLLISRKLDRAILGSSTAVTELCDMLCADFHSNATPLISHIPSGMGLLEYCERYFMDAKAAPAYFIAWAPGLDSYYTAQLVSKYIKPNISGVCDVSQLADRFCSFASHLKELYYRIKPTSVFTAEGLRYFLNTGIHLRLPPDYINPLEMLDRISVVENLLDDMKANRYTLRLLDPAKLTLSSAVSITCDPSLLLAGFSVTGGCSAFSCEITESSIVDAFKDFFAGLDNTKYLFSLEESVKIVEAELRKVRQE